MKNRRIVNICLIALTAAVTAVCAWVTVPGAVPFTLQTFGVFLALETLGAKRGTLAVIIYIALGMAGLPVFSGFRSGVAVVLGPTGGYIAGFVLCGLVYMLFEKVPEFRWRNIAAAASGMCLCYLFGTLWFMFFNRSQGSSYEFGAVLSICVLPFIIPDVLKITAAVIIAKRIKKALPKIADMKYNNKV